MLQYSSNLNGVMEDGDHLKNKAGQKSIIHIVYLLIFIFIFILF